jgi:tetratricopeptide (TPR) repeat protein
VRVMGSTEGPEVAGCSCASWMDASAASCPSPLDPCGQGRELPDRDQYEELWVTNDERLALAKRGNELVVLAVAGGAPVRTVPSKDPILGVEHHPMSALLDAVPPPAGIRVVIPERHATDASFEGSAKAWGNRCFEHLQADRLDAAEAACFAGLLTRGTNGTRGALTYNLGRIAEARGNEEGAREYYERSQRLRPSDATAKRLRALAGA